MTETFFKYLNAGGVSTHVPTFRWPLPTVKDGRWVPGEPVTVSGKLVPCDNGLHLCRAQDLLAWRGEALYVAQYRGERVDASEKIVVREARLVARVETVNDRMWRHFACDCAEHTLHLFEQRYPDDPRPRDAIRIARLYADGKTTDAERAAARDAARAAAGAAAWATERDAAGAAARDAAWAAAGATARDAAWATAREAAWDAAGDAARAAAGATEREAAWDAARAAAWATERGWQTTRLMEYLRGERP